MEELEKDIKNLEGENTPTLENLSESNTEQLLSEDNSLSGILEENTTDQINSSEKELIEEDVIVEEDVVEQEEADNIVKNGNDTYGNKLVTLRRDSEVETKKIETKIQEVKETDKDEIIGDIFINYDSEFRKNQRSILQKIRQFKMTPKTSIGFVLVMIIITIGGIGVMMKIDPKNHNVNNYKANILAMVGLKGDIKIKTGALDSSTGAINTGGVVSTGTGSNNSGGVNVTGPVDASSGVLEEKEKMMIKEKWLTINPEIIFNQDGSKSFMYKGESYFQDELQEVLRKEVQIEIDKKTKDYLNKIYLEAQSPGPIPMPTIEPEPELEPELIPEPVPIP